MLWHDKNIVIHFINCFLWGLCCAFKTSNNIPQQDNSVAIKPLALQPYKFQTQFAQGIDFIATGNEPFWRIEIDFDKFMHFKNARWI